MPPSPPPPSTGCIGSEGQDWKPQKTVCTSVAWFLFQIPLSLSCASCLFFCLPLFFLSFSSSSLLTFQLPRLPRPSSHIGDTEGLTFGFGPRWLKCACGCGLGCQCLLSPPCASGQDKERQTGGEEEGMQGGKKREPRTVKQHPTLMFHGIPERVNSHACETCQLVIRFFFSFVIL